MHSGHPWPSPSGGFAVQIGNPADLSNLGLISSTLSARHKKAPLSGRFSYLAERVGFEPTVRLNARLISSQVHSTTLPPLRWSRLRA